MDVTICPWVRMQVCAPWDFGFRFLFLPGGWRKGVVGMNGAVFHTLHKQYVLIVSKIFFISSLASFIKLKIFLACWKWIYLPTTSKNYGAIVMQLPAYLFVYCI